MSSEESYNKSECTLLIENNVEFQGEISISERNSNKEDELVHKDFQSAFTDMKIVSMLKKVEEMKITIIPY